jgi:hypothetical protein
MVLSEAIYVSIISACVAAGALLINKLKCVSNNGHIVSGCMDAPIQSHDSEVEVSIKRINGIDVMYLSKKHVEVHGDSESESDEESE